MNAPAPLSITAMVTAMSIDFGNAAGSPYGPMDMVLVEREAKNIESELRELRKAIALGDEKGVRDSLGDILVFGIGAFHKLGFSADRDVGAIIQALYSRFCTNEDQVKRTLDFYTQQGMEVSFEGTYPRVICRSARDQQLGDDYLPKGKFLKCIDYQQPIFDQYAATLLGVEETDVPAQAIAAPAAPSTPPAPAAPPVAPATPEESLLRMDGQRTQVPPERVVARPRSFMAMRLSEGEATSAVKEMAAQRESLMSQQDAWTAWVVQKLTEIRDEFEKVPDETKKAIMDGNVSVSLLLKRKQPAPQVAA